MKEKELIYEIPNRNKVKIILIISILFVLIVIGALFFETIIYSYIKDSVIFRSIGSVIRDEIVKFTSLGLFYASIIGGLFFIPMPLEIFFYIGLIKGNSIVISYILINIGYTISQYINYVLGVKFSPFILPFVSKRNIYKVRRYVNKYGGYAIFFSSIVPSPSEILVLALGITKYNEVRLFSLVILANGVKYAAIVLFFISTR